MNRLQSAIEDWEEAMVAVCDSANVVDVKRQMIVLLHDGERSLRRTDPNHPYRRFAASGSVASNARRLWRALDEYIEADSDRTDLAIVVARMFDEHESQVSKTHEILRRYRTYVERQGGGGGDSSSDNDSDDSD